MLEDEEDWGEWKGDGRRAHDDQRRPRSPTLPPTHVRAPVNQIELLHLPVRQQVPDLGSHRFGSRKLPSWLTVFFTTRCPALPH